MYNSGDADRLLGETAALISGLAKLSARVLSHPRTCLVASA
jgi:hypothetical protein